MAYLISSACTRCGACLTECPTGSIVEGSDKFYIDTDTCDDHASCVKVCPVNAISQRAAPKGGRGSAEEEEEEES